MKNGVKNIQAAAYNGACTVIWQTMKWQTISICKMFFYIKCQNNFTVENCHFKFCHNRRTDFFLILFCKLSNLIDLNVLGDGEGRKVITDLIWKQMKAIGWKRKKKMASFRCGGKEVYSRYIVCTSINIHGIKSNG